MDSDIIRIDLIKINFFGRRMYVIANIIKSSSQVVDIFPIEWSYKISAQFSKPCGNACASVYV